DSQLLAPVGKSVEAPHQPRQLAEQARQVLVHVAVVEKDVADSDRFFETPDLVPPARRYEQQIAGLDHALVRRRPLDKREAFEIGTLRIVASLVEKPGILG